MRTEADSQQYFPLMILAHVIMAGAFVWIYARGIEPKPWLAQGMRFGIAVALLGVVPTYLIYLRRPADAGALVVKQVVFDGILVVVVGAVAAFVCRSAPAKA